MASSMASAGIFGLIRASASRSRPTKTDISIVGALGEHLARRDDGAMKNCVSEPAEDFEGGVLNGRFGKDAIGHYCEWLLLVFEAPEVFVRVLESVLYFVNHLLAASF